MGFDSVSPPERGDASLCSSGEEVSESLRQSRDSQESGDIRGAVSTPNMSILARGAELLIKGYQCISRYTPAVCRFRPTCSEYTRQAIVKYGFWRGCLMGMWRILRCNPFNKQSGDDPVP